MYHIHQQKHIVAFVLISIFSITACNGSTLPNNDIAPIADFYELSPNLPSFATTAITKTDVTNNLAVINLNSSSQALNGSTLISNMETALKTVKTGQFTAEFAMSTVADDMTGILYIWGEQPNKLHVVVESDLLDLDGSTITVDHIAGWVYSPAQKTFYFSRNYPGTPHLTNQPMLHQLAEYARLVWEQDGLGKTEATIMGEETINGQKAYQVRVIPQNQFTPEFLQEIQLLIWLDQKTYLPWRIDIEASFQDKVRQGKLTITDMTINQPINPAMFAYTIPADKGLIVVDLDAMHPNQLTEAEQLVPDTP